MGSIQRENEVALLALDRHPQRSPGQIRTADEVVARLLVSQSRGLAQLSPPLVQWAMAAIIAAFAAAVVAVLALVGACATRGGLTLRVLGGALVTRDGARASRPRALWRAIVTWSPVPVALLLLRAGPRVQDATIGSALLQTAVLVPLAAGAVWALLHPSRGIQDRLAGTWIVPR